MKVSGFGYCNRKNQHKDVNIMKTESGKYYVEIDYCKSSEFDSLSNVEAIWKAIKEIEGFTLE